MNVAFFYSSWASSRTGGRALDLRGDGIRESLSRVSGQYGEKVDFDSIFTLVRKAVKSYLGKERVGIGLALSSLPAGLGAFWEVGGNYIVMNRNLIGAMKSMGRSSLEINSLVFVILMHEYLHSLGVLDEAGARELTRRICSNFFPEDHPAYLLSEKDPWQVYPFLMTAPGGRGEEMEIVRQFDTNSTSYIM
ncbi:MAG: hypothetical protein ACP5UO_03710 [Thermoplasmata archaeon]